MSDTSFVNNITKRVVLYYVMYICHFVSPFVILNCIYLMFLSMYKLGVFLGETSAVLYPSKDSILSQPVFVSPTPNTKTTQNKMAYNNWDMQELCEKIDLIVSSKIEMVVTSVIEIKVGQESLRKTFDSKIDKLRNDLMLNIDQTIKHLKDDMALELGRECSRIDTLMTKV